jgi:hypothetical protein
MALLYPVSSCSFTYVEVPSVVVVVVTMLLSRFLAWNDARVSRSRFQYPTNGADLLHLMSQLLPGIAMTGLVSTFAASI